MPYAARQWGRHKSADGRTKLVDRVLAALKIAPGTIRDICEEIGLPVTRPYLNQVSATVSELVKEGLVVSSGQTQVIAIRDGREQLTRFTNIWALKKP